MSSFICSAKHFNSIENKISDLILFNSNFSFPYSLKNEFDKMYNSRNYGQIGVKEELSGVMDSLRSLNATCVTLQYKSHYQGRVDTEIKKEKETLFNDKKTTKSLTTIGLYNALRCLSYQIETEHLEELGGMGEDENKAMLFLEAMINSVAHFALSCLPQNDSDNAWSL